MSLNREQRIYEALKELGATELKVINDSHKHAGHTQHLGGAGFTGETHYKVVVISPAFENLSRIDRQRKIMDLLKSEFTSGLHALEIKASAPSEVKAR